MHPTGLDDIAGVSLYPHDMSSSGKWRIKSARTIYNNRWIMVREYETVAPTGADAQYGLVHMHNHAIGILPIDEDGRTILIGQERFVFGSYSWELPEGGGNPEASPLEGAQRELSEEAGLKAEHWLELFGDVSFSNSVTDEKAYAFLAWGLSPDQSFAKDSSEELSVRRVSFAQALNMAVSGEITDAFTLVMLFKADHLLRTGALPQELAQLMLAAR
jgi:8-oxo-dGTP pyrophosphatase MutT (NUDIX family)